MAFTAYLNYNEYVDLGGTLPLESFVIEVRKAQRYLDYVTFNRIPQLTKIPDEVKEVLTEYINRLDSYGKQSLDGQTISQYSNGVEQITYRRGTEVELKQNMYGLAKEWLPDYLLNRMANFDVRDYLQSEDNNTE